jgi:hypothetical protein
MTTNWQAVNGNGSEPEDPMWFLKNTGKNIVDDYEHAINRAIEKSQAIREAERKFGTPGTADITLRREGLLRRVNPEDRERANALKANRDRGILTAHHLKDLGGFAVNGQQYVLDVVTRLTQITDDLPNDLQPVGELLTNTSTRVLITSYGECLKLLAEMGFQEIAQATKPKQQQ